jgi:hypothetical protein
LQTGTKKNSQGLLQIEEQNNEECSETFSAISAVYSDVLETRDRFVSRKLHNEEDLQDCRLESHIQSQTNDKVDYLQENMEVTASCHAVRQPVTTAGTPDVKGLSCSSVIDTPTLCTTKANKIIQFNSDSNSDADAEDDLIRSSQGDEESGRKWYVIS